MHCNHGTTFHNGNGVYSVFPSSSWGFFFIRWWGYTGKESFSALTKKFNKRYQYGVRHPALFCQSSISFLFFILVSLLNISITKQIQARIPTLGMSHIQTLRERRSSWSIFFFFCDKEKTKLDIYMCKESQKTRFVIVIS